MLENPAGEVKALAYVQVGVTVMELARSVDGRISNAAIAGSAGSRHMGAALQSFAHSTPKKKKGSLAGSGLGAGGIQFPARVRSA